MELADPTAPLTASGNLRRRELVSVFVEKSATAAAMSAVAVLCFLVYSVASRGAGVLSVGFLTKDPPLFQGAGGGIAPALVGTLMIMLVATAIAAPVGVLTAFYITEFASVRVARVIRLVLDLLNGTPTIVVGIFVFGFMVSGKSDSGFAGSVALSLVMLPLIARTTQEVLLLVPANLREAADALGVNRWRSATGVVLPSALGGILTGTVLAMARAAGETAPLLLVDGVFNADKTSVNLFGHAVPNIPVMIFQLADEANPNGLERAWGAALVLLIFILFANLGARSLLNRSRAKLGG